MLTKRIVATCVDHLARLFRLPRIPFLDPRELVLASASYIVLASAWLSRDWSLRVGRLSLRSHSLVLPHLAKLFDPPSLQS